MTGVDQAILDELLSACAEYGVAPEVALSEKAKELRARTFLRCIPNQSLRPEQIDAFIREVVGRADAKLVESVTRIGRDVRLTDADRVTLEVQQNLRCGVCGVYLDREAKPHVDHIIPIALGGKNDPTNLQLLCHRCNGGKSDLPIWLLGIPFQRVGQTLRLRYCVFSRAESRCEEDGCGLTSRDAELFLGMRVPAALGGRDIYDNLLALCEEHRNALRSQRHRKALENLRSSRAFGTLQMPA